MVKYFLITIIFTIAFEASARRSSLDFDSDKLLLLQLHNAESLFDVNEAFLFETQNLRGPYRPFTYKELEKIIKKNRIKKISDLIKYLPSSFLGSRVEIYHSRSLQCATPTAPRVVMFSLDGGLLCSYNSGLREDYKDIDGGMGCNLTTDHLECLKRNKKGFLEPVSLVFQEEEQRTNITSVSIQKQINDIDPEFIKTIGHVKALHKGRACASCHQSNFEDGNKLGAKILWDQYWLWPGVYGSVDDNAFDAEAPAREKKLLFDYIAGAKKRARYQNLPKNILTRPAFALNNIQAVSNADRILRSIYLSESYSKYNDLLTATVNMCPKLKENPKAMQSVNMDYWSRVKDMASRYSLSYLDEGKSHGEKLVELQIDLLGKNGVEVGRAESSLNDMTDGFPRMAHSIAKNNKFHYFRAIADLMGVPTDTWAGNIDGTEYYFNAAHSVEVPSIVHNVIQAVEPKISCSKKPMRERPKLEKSKGRHP